MEHIKHYLERAVQEDASDIFIIAGKVLSKKKDGVIVPMSDERLMPDVTEVMIRDLYAMAKRHIDEKVTEWDDDFSLSLPGTARFRVNVFQQRGSLASVIRVVNYGIPDWQEYGIPAEVMRIAEQKRGMVLVTGPAGSGKSTTLACIVEKINETRNAHIITIEDPIEYLHQNKMGIVSQRELYTDTDSYVTALRASLRQMPDVILLGEMRDLDTIQTAMTAAETGHLVLSTLHTLGAVNTVDRIIDVFPPAQQQQIRVQLAQVLKTVVSQQLVPTTKGSVVPAVEIMHLNTAIRTMIRDNRVHQMDTVIQTSGAEGMCTMDDSILRLYKAGTISREAALNASPNAEQLKRKL